MHELGGTRTGCYQPNGGYALSRAGFHKLVKAQTWTLAPGACPGIQNTRPKRICFANLLQAQANISDIKAEPLRLQLQSMRIRLDEINARLLGLARCGVEVAFEDHATAPFGPDQPLEDSVEGLAGARQLPLGKEVMGEPGHANGAASLQRSFNSRCALSASQSPRPRSETRSGGTQISASHARDSQGREQ